jgi:arylsulfatase A-like enzyme
MSGDFTEAIRLGANMAGFNVPGIGRQSIPLRSYYDMVMDWIEGGDEPFFVWLFLLEVHSPYRPTREYRNIWLPEMLRLNLVRSHLFDRDPTAEEAEKLLELYDGTISVVDSLVKELLGDLEQYDPTLVFHSDHGESFGEHDNFGHNEFLYEENVHVPLMVSNCDESGRVDDHLSLRELPTIVSRIADGESLTDGSLGGDRSVSQVNHERVAVRRNDRKYIFDETGGRCYDLEVDPDELEPTGGDDPEGLSAIASHVETQLEKEAIARASAEVDSA